MLDGGEFMNRIAIFVDSFIPKNIPKKKARVLKDELTCHILDKADFYREIGYDDAESINKAIEDFGTQESEKSFIFNEFEELYSEKNIFGILSFFIIGAMNLVCGLLGLFVISADFNRYPDPLSAFISFAMIFVVLTMIAVARIKKYRKTLISIGVVNTLIAVILLSSYYPQMASYAMGYNVMYLVDILTPFAIAHISSLEDLFAMVLWESFLLIPSLYCFTAARRIKRGKAKSVKNPKKKIIVFSSIFFVIALVSCIIYPASKAFVDDYPEWFDIFYNYISEESQQRFDELPIGCKYSEASNHLTLEGYVTIEQYKDTLDRITKKQFNTNLKKFNFAEGYEIWFKPQEEIEGNGFVGIKQENGIVIGKVIGNVGEKIYTGLNNFGYSDYDSGDDMFAMFDYFRALKKGDAEAEVMSKFGSKFGYIYTKRKSLENDKEISYYRVHCYGFANPNEEIDIERYDSRYIELTFEDGLLIDGAMYDKIYTDDELDEINVKSERIK